MQSVNWKEAFRARITARRTLVARKKKDVEGPCGVGIIFLVLSVVLFLITCPRSRHLGVVERIISMGTVWRLDNSEICVDESLVYEENQTEYFFFSLMGIRCLKFFNVVGGVVGAVFVASIGIMFEVIAGIRNRHNTRIIDAV